jgi:hypothetical protein
MGYSAMDWSYSNVPVLYIHEEKGYKQYFSNSNVGSPFRQKCERRLFKNASSLAHQASNNKNEIVAHPTDHGNAHFEPIQQPTNNPAVLVLVIPW